MQSAAAHRTEIRLFALGKLIFYRTARQFTAAVMFWTYIQNAPAGVWAVSS